MFPLHLFSSFFMFRSDKAIWKTNTLIVIKLSSTINCYTMIVVDLFFQQFFSYSKTFDGGITSPEGYKRIH